MELVPDLLVHQPALPGHLGRRAVAMTTKSMRYSRRSLALAAVVVGVAGLGMASAAQLSVNESDVVAGLDVVVNCDADGVTLNYTPVYQTGPPSAYVVTTMTVGDLNDVGSTCSGTISVTVADVSGAALATGSVALPSLPATTALVTLSSPVVVSSMFGVAVAIS